MEQHGRFIAPERQGSKGWELLLEGITSLALLAYPMYEPNLLSWQKSIRQNHRATILKWGHGHWNSKCQRDKSRTLTGFITEVHKAPCEIGVIGLQGGPECPAKTWLLGLTVVCLLPPNPQTPMCWIWVLSFWAHRRTGGGSQIPGSFFCFI